MKTDIIAHRGASRQAPENTMAAFQLADEFGVNGIETDIHLTKDSVPVLIHDAEINRTTNQKGYVKDLYYSEINQFDAGSWFGKDFYQERIISLENFLRWIKPKKLSLHIELKNQHTEYKHLEVIVYEMIQHYDLLPRTTLSTFSRESIKRMNRLNFNVERALLTSKTYKELPREAKQLGAHALHVKYRFWQTEMMKRSRAENLKLRVYTVNKRRQIIRCLMNKWDGIITDLPELNLFYRHLLNKPK